MRTDATGPEKGAWVERWWLFLAYNFAYNSPAVYGFGDAFEADAYCDVLNNRRRDANLYSYEEVTDTKHIEVLESGRDTDGRRLDEELAAAERNNEL